MLSVESGGETVGGERGRGGGDRSPARQRHADAGDQDGETGGTEYDLFLCLRMRAGHPSADALRTGGGPSPGDADTRARRTGAAGGRGGLESEDGGADGVGRAARRRWPATRRRRSAAALGVSAPIRRGAVGSPASSLGSGRSPPAARVTSGSAACASAGVASRKQQGFGAGVAAGPGSAPEGAAAAAWHAGTGAASGASTSLRHAGQPCRSAAGAALARRDEGRRAGLGQQRQGQQTGRPAPRPAGPRGGRPPPALPVMRRAMHTWIVGGGAGRVKSRGCAPPARAPAAGPPLAVPRSRRGTDSRYRR